MQTNITVTPSNVNKQTTGRRFALGEDNDVFIAIVPVLDLLVTTELKLVEGVVEALRPSRMIDSGWHKPLVSFLELNFNFQISYAPTSGCRDRRPCPLILSRA